MIVWIDRQLALALHDRQLAEHGGSSGVRDDNMLESALARPQQLHAYGDPAPDLADLAASLAFGIARNHPFVDGNKRTAYVCCRVFLALNGAELVAEPQEKYVTILGLAEGKMKVEGYANWLRNRITVTPPKSVQEPRPRYGKKPRRKIRKARK